MAYCFDGFAPLTNTPTQITFAYNPDELLAGQNVQVRLNGSGLAFNATTGVMTGTVTSLELYDAIGGHVLQTVTIDAAQQALVAGNVTSLLTKAKAFGGPGGTLDTWGALVGVDHASPTFSGGGTILTLDLFNASNVLIGKLVFVGTGLTQQTTDTLGVVTSVTHLDAAGNPIAGHSINYAPGTMPASAIAYSLGNDENLYLEFVRGNDTINNTAFLVGDLGRFAMDGGGGNDTFTSNGVGGYADYRYATAGVNVNITYAGGPTTGTATGGGGNDNLQNIGGIGGSLFNDTITAGVAANSLAGSEGDNSIVAGDGDDFVAGDDGFYNADDPRPAGNDTLDGGNGSDTVTFISATGSVVMTLSASGGATVTAAGIGTDVISNFENINGGQAGDNITGNALANIIDGGPGDDTLNGAGGIDWVSYASAQGGVNVSLAIAGAQNTGGGGTDMLSGFEAINGGNQNDTLAGNGSDNTLDGRGGTDTANLGAATGMISLFLSASGGATVTAAGIGTDTLLNFENVISGSGNDFLQGNALANRIEAGAGFDNVYGGGGNDSLYGGINEDVLVGDAGNDSVFGGDGGDILSELFDSLGSGDDFFDGGNGVDIMYSAAGNDEVYGGGDAANNYANLGLGNDQYSGASGTDVVEAGAGLDLIYGAAGDDSIYGDADNDTVYGGSGIDLLSGSTGNDSLDGGDDNDLLIGDDGTDTLLGSDGIDVMYGFADNDTLNGGIGGDVDAFYGGAGNDTYQVGGTGYDYDYLWDFVGGAGASDVIALQTGATITLQYTSSGNYYIDLSNGSHVVVVGVTSILAEDIVLNGF